MFPAAELRKAREQAGLTQTELACRSNTSQATLSAYERGTKAPSIATLARLLAACGARLAVESGHQPLTVPSARRHERTARQLARVLALAEALPTRHARELRFPRLGTDAT